VATSSLPASRLEARRSSM